MNIKDFKVDDEVIIVTSERDYINGGIIDVFRTEKITSVTNEYLTTAENKYDLRHYAPTLKGLVSCDNFIFKSMRDYNDYILCKDINNYLMYGVSYRFSPEVLRRIIHESEN